MKTREEIWASLTPKLGRTPKLSEVSEAFGVGRSRACSLRQEFMAPKQVRRVARRQRDEEPTPRGAQPQRDQEPARTTFVLLDAAQLKRIRALLVDLSSSSTTLTMGAPADDVSKPRETQRGSQRASKAEPPDDDENDDDDDGDLRYQLVASDGDIIAGAHDDIDNAIARARRVRAAKVVDLLDDDAVVWEAS